MNKLFGLFLLALAFLAPSVANAATCFWFGGSNNLNNVGSWFAATGGTGGACAAAGGWPNSTADTATFDASSGTGTITRNVNWTVGQLNYASATGGLTLGNSGDTATVNLIGFNVFGSGTRTINLGASTWTCGVAATSACTWGVGGSSNLTFNANTSTVVMAGSTSGSGTLCQFGTFTYNVITFNPDQATGRGSVCNTSNTTVATLNIGAPNYIMVNSGNSFTVTGNLNFTGGTPSQTALTTILSNTPGTAITFTLSNAATCSYCAFNSVTAVTNSITGTNAINLGSNTNLNLTWPAGTGGGGRIIGG